MTKVYRTDGSFLGDFDITDLQNADLSGADLRNSNLRGANLQNANLKGANLRNSCLWTANLKGANLINANLQDVDLCNADLEGAKLPKFQIPQGKSLIVWKKIFVFEEFSNGYAIAKLRIPARAKRTASLVGKKCRAERAFVEEIYDLLGKKKFQKGVSIYENEFIYGVGTEIMPENGYSDDIREECKPGIHFFMTEQEAIRY